MDRKNTKPSRNWILAISLESLAGANRLTCRFHYQISRRESDGGTTLLTRGFTAHACVDRKGALSAFPQVIRDAIAPILERQRQSPVSTTP